jgi:general nucleoside transport system permease protein
VSAKWAYALAIVISVGIVIFYVMDPTVTTSVVSFSLRYAVPLILAAMVGIMCERSGVINIGIEGQMLMSAFAGFFGAALTGNLILGTMIGVGTGMIMGAMRPAP